MSIKVLLVDGSDVMRSAIRQLLKNELGIEVIGTASSFAEALVLTAAWKPDVLLMSDCVDLCTGSGEPSRGRCSKWMVKASLWRPAPVYRANLCSVYSWTRTCQMSANTHRSW